MNSGLNDHTCSMRNCLSPAVTTEEAVSDSWRFTVFYCDEHAREVRLGTPVGPLGVDPAKIEVVPLGSAVPNPAGNRAISPQ